MKLTKNEAVIDNFDDILSVREAAELFDINPKAMYKRTERRQVPFHKINNRTYFLKSELLSLMRDSTRY